MTLACAWLWPLAAVSIVLIVCLTVLFAVVVRGFADFDRTT